MLKNEINFSIDGVLNDNEKAKYDLKCDVNLMNKYNLKDKATIISDKTRDEDKTREQLDNIVIINNEKNKKKIK